MLLQCIEEAHCILISVSDAILYIKPTHLTFHIFPKWASRQYFDKVHFRYQSLYFIEVHFLPKQDRRYSDPKARNG